MQGIVGVFRDLDSTVDAVESLKKMRAGDITVYSPAPRHEIEHVIAHGPSPVRRFTLRMGRSCSALVLLMVSRVRAPM